MGQVFSFFDEDNDKSNNENILEEDIFVRVHKSHIVNMRYIIDLEPACFEIKFEKGNSIGVSRRKLKELVKKFAIYRFK
jgi:DNA-binding LytR/AlgR family response regulator